MKRLPLLLLLALAICFISCEEDGVSPPPTPSAPEDLTISAVTDNSVSLAWTDNSPFETGFRVQRTTAGSGSWTTIADSLPRDTDRFTDTGLEEGSKFNYRIKAFNAFSETEPSNVVEAATLPKAPTELKAKQDTVNFTQIKLEWSDESEKETGYLLQREHSENDSIITVATEIEADATEHVNEECVPGTRYTYTLWAMIDTLKSAPSNTVVIRPRVLTPNPPSDLTARATSPNTILLRWVDQAMDNDGFIIERRLLQDVEWSFLDSLVNKPNDMSYIDDGLTGETTYYYHIASYNARGTSPFSDEASATTPQGPPAKPDNLRIGNADYDFVTLEWDDNSGDELGFELARRNAGASVWDDEFELGQDMPIYTDHTVVMNRTYFYHVRSFNAAGPSEWSNELEVVIPNGPPLPPRITNIETKSTSSIFIEWQPNTAGNHTGFILERAVQGGEFAQVGGDLSGNLYTDTGLEENTLYFYRVFAFNEIGDSDYSSVDSAQTWSSIIIADGFEDYTVNQPPDDPPWNVYTRGGSTVLVTDIDPQAGTNCVHFIDSNPTPTDSAYCYASLPTRPVQKCLVSCWLKIAPDGFFGVRGADPRNYITFWITFINDGSIVVLTGVNIIHLPQIRYPVNQWFHLEVRFDTRIREYIIAFDGEDRVIASLQRADHTGNTLVQFMTFSDVTLNNGYLDEVEITDTIDEAVIMGAPELLTGGDNGNIRVGDIFILPEPTR